MSGKGSAQRPPSVPKSEFNQSFDRIFGVTCKRCGKSGLQPDSVHTCSPQIKEKADVYDTGRTEDTDRVRGKK